jgi:hypothetical protein
MSLGKQTLYLMNDVQKHADQCAQDKVNADHIAHMHDAYLPLLSRDADTPAPLPAEGRFARCDPGARSCALPEIVPGLLD